LGEAQNRSGTKRNWVGASAKVNAKASAGSVESKTESEGEAVAEVEMEGRSSIRSSIRSTASVFVFGCDPIAAGHLTHFWGRIRVLEVSKRSKKEWQNLTEYQFFNAILSKNDIKFDEIEAYARKILDEKYYYMANAAEIYENLTSTPKTAAEIIAELDLDIPIGWIPHIMGEFEDVKSKKVARKGGVRVGYYR
jgi:hypothetical protein